MPWWNKSKTPGFISLEQKADGSNKVPPLLTDKYRSLHCFENVRKLPTKYNANTNFWINIVIFEDYITRLDRKIGTENLKIVVFIDQC